MSRTPRHSPGLILLCIVSLLASVWSSLPADAQAEDMVKVGSKKFTESIVLGEVVRLELNKAGIAATHDEQLGGTRVLFSALSRGDIDVYPEYTGTIAAEIFASEVEASDYEGLRRRLAEQNIVMSKPLGFQNTYAIGMLESRAEELGIRTVSDLARHPDLKLGFSNEFLDREDGWKGLKSAYGLPHRDVTGLDHDLAYKGLESGSIDAMDVYTTDAEIPYYELRVLADDRSYFPDYAAVILSRGEIDSDVDKALNGLADSLDETAMRAMNRAVKIEGRDESAVAAQWVGVRDDSTEESWVTRIAGRTVEHLVMVVISLTAAIIIAIPLGIVAWRRRKFGEVILGAVGILQTIPSLALLVLMIPLLGIGTIPAIVALFLYSLLPIVRNTHSGFAEIDEATRRAARGIGLTKRQILRHVELPLALGSILAGVKTAAVINVGTATLGALIGAGGYGQPILTGIRLDDVGLILEGAIPAALLALMVQWSFDLYERFARRPRAT